jgi:hypothetical protein
MQFHPKLGTGIVIFAVLTAVLCQYALGQDAPGRDAKGLPPRAAPGDYQTHIQAGSVTLAAEFTGHSLPTPDAVLSTENYVAVEVGFFGQPGAHLNLSPGDFSLRINGKKAPSPAQPYAVVFKSLKDPNYVTPGGNAAKSKTSLGGGGDQNASPLPPIVHIPIDVERTMEQRVQKAALPEGDRPLPQAGLIFFEHHGKVTSVELTYTGAAGTAILTLQP